MAAAPLATVGRFAGRVTILLWLILLLGYLGRLHWIFDLFSNFRPQYAALFAGSALLLLLAKRPRTAAIALLGAAVTIGSVAANTSLPPTTPELDAEAKLRIATFNVWFRNQDLQSAAQFFENSGADVILLQELNSQRAYALGKLLPSYPFVVIGEEARGDAVIYSRLPLLEQQWVELAPGGARAALIAVSVQGRRIHVAGVHLHWPMGARNASLRNAELDGLALLARSQSVPLVIAGDFNLTPWSPLYSRFVAASGLRNCVQGFTGQATWPVQLPPLRIRIDHCFVSRAWFVAATWRGQQLGSDHLPAFADLQLSR